MYTHTHTHNSLDFMCAGIILVLTTVMLFSLDWSVDCAFLLYVFNALIHSQSNVGD